MKTTYTNSRLVMEYLNFGILMHLMHLKVRQLN